MSSSRQVEGDASQSESTRTEKRIPISPTKIHIRGHQCQADTSTGLQETIYRVTFPEFRDDEAEYTERDLLSDPSGVEALRIYRQSLAARRSTEESSPSRLSRSLRSHRRMSFSSTPHTVKRVSELRDGNSSRRSESLLSPVSKPSSCATPMPQIRVQVMPTPPPVVVQGQEEDVLDEDAQDAMQWSYCNFNDVIPVPHWQKNIMDLTLGSQSETSEVHVEEESEEQKVAEPSSTVVAVAVDNQRVMKMNIIVSAQAYLPNGNPIASPQIKTVSLEFPFCT